MIRAALAVACLALSPLAGAVDSGQRFDDHAEQSRYGDFVLLKPPVAPRTWALWLAPALFLAGGIGVVLVVVRRRARAARVDPASLDEEPDRT